jgi:hypothetical protein
MFTRLMWCSRAYCDFYSQRSVISTRSVILTRTNVIATLTTVISTLRVWCWHLWVWLWNSFVPKPHSACRNHSCVWCLHAYRDEHKHECNFWTQRVISTRTSVIYIRKVRCSHVECDFDTQKCTYDTTTVFQHAQEWFLHAECDYDTQECDNDTTKLNTHELNFNTMRVTLKLTN